VTSISAVESTLEAEDELQTVLAAACEGLQDVRAARFEVDGLDLGVLDLWYDLLVIIDQIPSLLETLAEGEPSEARLVFSSQGKERIIRFSDAEGAVSVRSERYDGTVAARASTTKTTLQEDLLRLGQTFVCLCTTHVPLIAAHPHFQEFAGSFDT